MNTTSTSSSALVLSVDDLASWQVAGAISSLAIGDQRALRAVARKGTPLNNRLRAVWAMVLNNADLSDVCLWQAENN